MLKEKIELYLLVAFIINAVVNYFIIEAASRSKKNLLLLNMQVKLLAKIAKSNGIADDDINKILTMK